MGDFPWVALLKVGHDAIGVVVGTQDFCTFSFFLEWGVFVSQKSSAENLGHFPLFPSHEPFLPVASDEGMIQKKHSVHSRDVFFFGPTQKNPQTKKHKSLGPCFRG